MHSLSWDLEKYTREIYGLTEEGYESIRSILLNHYDQVLDEDLEDDYTQVWADILHSWELGEEIEGELRKGKLREHLEYVYNSLDTLQDDPAERLQGADHTFILSELEKVMDQL